MNRWQRPALVTLTLLANLALAAPALRYGAAFTLLWLLPGLAWAGLLTDHRRRPAAEELAIGLGLGFGSTVLLTLLLHYIPGPLPFTLLLVAVNLLTFILIFLPTHPHPSKPINEDRSLFIVHCSLIILIAALFRLVNLGYSEFQGDEGIVMQRAARAILGDDAQLFYHQKGPIEILLPTATWTLSGAINEWQARLPFAFAGLLGVVALYLLGRRWFNERSGWIAALLLAINGYFVGFGRIVQYQSIVLALTALALLALWRWSQAEGDRWLIAGAALLACGVLAHYDAALALPAAAYIVGRRLWFTRSGWRALVMAGLLACVILALFYIPFVLHPNFSKTIAYLGKARIGTGGPLYNNLLSSLPLATFYNSAYYLIGLACLLVVASFLSFRRWGLLIPASCLLCSFAPLLTGPALALLLSFIILSRRSSTPSRAAWLWFGAPFLFYYFLVWDPRTHVLNAFPGAVLLAAFALDYFMNRVSPSPCLGVSLSPRHFSLLIVCSSLFILLAYYPYSMFVQHTPEIKRTWPAHQPTLYWKPDAETPLFGYFGFPYRAGWKVVGVLIEEGILDGVYASNEEQEVTGWYTRGAERTYCPGPEWYFIAKNVQDEVAIQQTDVEENYHVWGEIQVAGEPKLWIYYQGPPVTPPQLFHVEDYASRFDARTTPASTMPPPLTDYTPAGHTLGESIRLLGYCLDATDARPGGSIGLVLYWEPLRPIETNYQVFNHLYDGTMWGQQDGTPGCALQPTVLWNPGQIVRDEYTIPIDPAAPAGDIPLLVGMYSLETEQRLPVRAPDDPSIGDAIPLAVVTVR
jgi:4-amino-4-deoxy-L-arabinose transferase-like glycosyltransferase